MTQFGIYPKNKFLFSTLLLPILKGFGVDVTVSGTSTRTILVGDCTCDVCGGFYADVDYVTVTFNNVTLSRNQVSGLLAIIDIGYGKGSTKALRKGNKVLDQLQNGLIV